MSAWPMVSRLDGLSDSCRSGESYCEKALFGVRLITPAPVVADSRANALGFVGKIRRAIASGCRGAP